MHAHAGEICDRLLVRVLYVRRAELWPWWNFPRLCDGFWRLYWHNRDGAAITWKQRLIPLPARQAVIIPAQVTFATTAGPGVEQLYANLDVVGCPPRLTQAPMVVPKDAALDVMFADLSEQIPREATAVRSLSHMVGVKAAFLRAFGLLVRQHPEAEVVTSWDHTSGGVERCLRGMSDDPGHPWTIAELAAYGGMSSSRLHHHFQRAVGVAPLRWLAQRRIALAAQYLAEGTRSIPEIAALLGYHNRQHLTRLFSQAYGCPPAAYRRRTTVPLAEPPRS